METASDTGPGAPAGHDTRERIMQAAEAVLRRHGPAKTNVVDVARALGMSHANVYRHFASKAELMDALVARWLARDSAVLERIARSDAPADERVTEWMLAFIKAKQKKVLEDPEMFAAYRAAAEMRREVANAHMNASRAMFVQIIREGIESGVFSDMDPEQASEDLFTAMTRFYHPHFLRNAGESPPPESEARRVLALVIAGLKPQS